MNLKRPYTVMLLGLIALSACLQSASAQYYSCGSRCGRSYYHSLASTYNWNASCYNCHPQPTGTYSTSSYNANSYSPNPGSWRRDILRIAENQSNWAGSLAYNAGESKAFAEALNSLGLSGAFKAQAAGLAQQYGFLSDPYSSYGYAGYATGGGGGYGATGYSPYAQQGATQYGYQSMVQQYGNIDMNAALNHAARLTGQANELSGNALGDFNSAIKDLGTGQNEAAKILAQGYAAAASMQAAGANAVNALQAAKAPPQQPASKSFTLQQTIDAQSGQPTAGTVSSVTAYGIQPVTQVITTNCLQCHNDKQAANNLNLLQWNSFNGATKRQIYARVTSQDPAKVMPRDPSDVSKPGRHLSIPELTSFEFDIQQTELGENLRQQQGTQQQGTQQQGAQQQGAGGPTANPPTPAVK